MQFHEQLERRRLLSAAVEFDPASHALQVFGSLGGDGIRVQVEQGRVTVFDAGTMVYRSADDGQRIAAVKVYGMMGDDHIDVTLRNSVIGVQVYGQQDHDFIGVWADPGVTGFAVYGGPGDDVIHGSTRADMIFGEAGNDIVFAGNGDDRIDGGTGDDVLSGEEGDDFLDHGGGTDLLDGGNGYDSAIVCNCDQLFEIERTLFAVDPMAGGTRELDELLFS